MLLRYHRKGDSGFRLTRARAVIIDVLIQNLFNYAREIAKDAVGKLRPMCILQLADTVVENFALKATLI